MIDLQRRSAVEINLDDSMKAVTSVNNVTTL